MNGKLGPLMRYDPPRPVQVHWDPHGWVSASQLAWQRQGDGTWRAHVRFRLRSDDHATNLWVPDTQVRACAATGAWRGELGREG